MQLRDEYLLFFNLLSHNSLGFCSLVLRYSNVSKNLFSAQAAKACNFRCKRNVAT